MTCSIELLQELLKKPVSTGNGPKVQKLMQVLVHPAPDKPCLVSNVQRFFDVTADQLWKCIPAPKVQSTSEFHSQYVAAIVSLLSNNREVLMEALESCVIMPPPVLQCFLCQFINLLSIRVEAAFVRAVRTPHVSSVYSGTSECRDNLQDREIQQTVHYVGGAAVKSVLSKATRASKSTNWKNISSVTQKRILVGELVEAPAEILCQWTDSRNRGVLKFIGSDMLVFFMALCEILKQLEKDDGSLLHAEVIQHVKTSYLMSLLWDELINDSLEEDESELLKYQLILSFTNTWGSSIAQRRLNAVVNPGDNEALRAKLSK